MTTEIPSAEAVRDRLKMLKGADLESIAGRSGVPCSTLWKIRTGVTPNPGIETVRKFFHLLPSTDTSTQQAAGQGVANV
jgi:predicted transcriptional regulator